jgi:hypothetical protein
MKTDDFEQLLQYQPLRQPPATWRAEILAAARSALRAPSPLRGERAGVRGAIPQSWWRELLWPSPWAWAGVASAWSLILFLNTEAASSNVSSVFARSQPLPPAAIKMAIAERRQLLMSLFESAEPPEPPGSPFLPRPHSEIRVRQTYA